jgi:hypothetical protein
MRRLQYPLAVLKGGKYTAAIGNSCLEHTERYALTSDGAGLATGIGAATLAGDALTLAFHLAAGTDVAFVVAAAGLSLATRAGGASVPINTEQGHHGTGWQQLHVLPVKLGGIQQVRH